VGEKRNGRLGGGLIAGVTGVARYLGEVGQAGMDEILYHCEVSTEQFTQIKYLLRLARKWTLEGQHTKVLYSLPPGSIWDAAFGQR